MFGCGDSIEFHLFDGWSYLEIWKSLPLIWCLIKNVFSCWRMIWKLLLCQISKVNPRELSPYFKDNGTGYPEESDRTKSDIDKLPPPRIVGDGGLVGDLKHWSVLRRKQLEMDGGLKRHAYYYYFFLYTR